MRRESRSLPRRSVPSQNRALGASGRPSMVSPSVNCSEGSYGATHGAATASERSAPMASPPKTADGCRLSLVHSVRRGTIVLAPRSRAADCAAVLDDALGEARIGLVFTPLGPGE